MNLQDPNTPPGLYLNDSIEDSDSFEVSISSSLNTPNIPFSAAKTLPIFLFFLASKINAPAVAFITAVTPPDCA